MKKLIELLNEYSLRYIKNKYLINWKIGENPIGIYGYVREYGLGWASKLIIISKEFGFIKWLVDNDKIDIKEIQYFGTDDMKEAYSIEESLLMLLAISEQPIEDLLSYLK